MCVRACVIHRRVGGRLMVDSALCTLFNWEQTKTENMDMLEGKFLNIF